LALEDKDVGLLVQVEAEGDSECVHWNEFTLGFLRRVMEALGARIRIGERRVV
jgi:hypothetical protein